MYTLILKISGAIFWRTCDHYNVWFVVTWSFTIMFHFPFKYRFSVAFSPSTTVSLQPYRLIAWYIIVPYEYDNTFINYVAKAHLYLVPKLLVSSHAVHILDTYILFQSFKIYETYYHVNHIHIIHCRQL